MKETVFDRKQTLLDAALEEFSQKSFDEASINRILKISGISKGVFYYHFQDKEALYFSLLAEASRLKWDFITKELCSADFSQIDIFETFRLQARAGIRFAELYPHYHSFCAMVARERNPVVRAHIETAFLTSDKLEQMIDQAIQNGDFSGYYSKDFLRVITGYLFAHYDDIFPNDRESYRNLDDYIAMMKNGLGKK